MELVAGKVAVVTGAASGIGRALAGRFADAGLHVVLADIEQEALDKAVAEVSSSGAEAIGVVTDVSHQESVDSLRDATVDRFGTAHVVCNNAGVATGGLVWDQSLDDWNWVLGVNLFGVIHGIRAFTPLLREQGEGHIVNTASMAGLTSPPLMGIYNVTKHAVVTLSETMFGELAMEQSPVGVSVLCPGWVNTRIHEADRNRPASSPDDPAPGVAGPAGTDPALFRDTLGGMLAAGLAPDHVAELVLDAIRARRFYILTHPDWAPMISARTDHIVAGEDPGMAFLPT